MSKLSDRIAKLTEVAEIGRELEPLLSQVVQQRFFAAVERQCVNVMIDAKTDDERRHAANFARAARELQSFIRNAVDAASRAPDTIAKLREKSDE